MGHIFKYNQEWPRKNASRFLSVGHTIGFEIMAGISLEHFLADLRSAQDKDQTPFLGRLLEYAIAKTERMMATHAKRPRGSLRRIPPATAAKIDEAIATRDVGKILAIRDMRGSHGADEDRLTELIKMVISRAGDASEVSTRQLKREARKNGLRVDRGRIEELRQKLSLAVDKNLLRANRVSDLKFIDLAFVHLQADLLVFGFTQSGCDEWVERISKLRKDIAPPPRVVPTSADRSRVVNLQCQLVETMTAFAGSGPDWGLLQTDLKRIEDTISFFLVRCSKKVPSSIRREMPQCAAVVTCEPDWLCRDLLRPEMVFLGAGYMPTLADTLERMSSTGKGNTSFSVYQKKESRTDALWLRLCLQEKLADHGILVKLGPRQAFRLAWRPELKPEISDGAQNIALVVPSPIHSPIFRLEKPGDADCLPLDFNGAEALLANSRVDDCAHKFKQVLDLQRKFAISHKTEPMLKCAEFFCNPCGEWLSSIYDVMQRRHDFRKMTDDVRTIWSAYALTLFDPDYIAPDFGALKLKEGKFFKAFEQFWRGGLIWIEEWHNEASRWSKASLLEEDAINATVISMEQQLTRVWKYGMDEAAQRVTEAIDRVGRDHQRLARWINDPKRAIPELASALRQNWPTVWIERKKIINRANWILRSIRADMQKESNKTVAIISSAEKEWEGLRVETIRSEHNLAAEAATNETIEMLIKERLEEPIPVTDDWRLAAWYRRFLGTVRRTFEENPKNPNIPDGILPRSLVRRIFDGFEQLNSGGDPAELRKIFYDDLQEFFDDQV